MNFRCTKKAQVRLRLTPSGLAPVPDTVSTVDWHCNVVTLGKRPFFLFAHSQSLYAFFVAAAGNSPLDAFGRAFRDQLAAALAREGVAAGLGARLMDDGPDTICRAIDRRVLGTMNDHVNMSRFYLYRSPLGRGHAKNAAAMSTKIRRDETLQFRPLRRCGPRVRRHRSPHAHQVGQLHRHAGFRRFRRPDGRAEHLQERPGQ